MTNEIHPRALEMFPQYPKATDEQVARFFDLSAINAPSTEYLEEHGYLTGLNKGEEKAVFCVAEDSFARVPFATFQDYWVPLASDIPEVDVDRAFTSYYLMSLWDADVGCVFGRVTSTGTAWIFKAKEEDFEVCVKREFDHDIEMPDWAKSWYEKFMRE